VFPGAVRASTRRRIAAAVAAVALVSVACSGGSGPGTKVKGAGSAGTPVLGGRIAYGLDAETQGGYCDTTAQLAASGIIVNQSIYDTLMVPDDKGGYAPYLAQALTHSPDYLTWTIKLRPGIQFQDAEPFDANAVKANFDAYRKGALFSFVFSNIVDEQVVDPMTVEIHMKKPWIAFAGYLWGTGRLGMIAPNHITASDCALHPVGTGPFMVREYLPNDHMTVVKNPRYWRKDSAGRQLPYLDELEFRPIIDPYQRLNALNTGQIQLMLTDNGDVIFQIRQAVNQGTLASVENQRGAEVAYTMLRVDKPPFDDIVARQAVAYAGNKVEVNQVVYHGVNRLTDTPFAPDVFGYVTEPITPPIHHDLTRAKQLVEQYKAAHGGQFRLTISSTNDPTVIKSAQLVQSQWQSAGIDVSVRTADQATLINQALGGQFQAVTWRNHPGGDPDGQYVWWHSKSPVNFNNFSDPQIDKDLEDGRSNLDVNARKADYEDLQRVFGRQLYNLWGFYALWTFASAPSVHGITGPDLPDGGRPGLIASVHPVVGIWLSK
jgi:peptide/nickel transport system substrate-binding protein